VAVAAASATVAFLLGAGAHAAGACLAAPSQWAAWGLAPPGDLLLLGLYLLCNPILEEWFWRGTLLQSGAPRWGRARRVFAVLGFLPFHAVFLYQSFGAGLCALATLAILAAALLWTALRVRSGNTWWSVASHLGADVGVVALYVCFLRGQVG